MSRLLPGPDGGQRCGWCVGSPDYVAYHDTEWGFPVAEDRRLFEMLCLEGFQAGLSWRTILAKRENFRRAFHGFDPARMASFDEADVTRLMQDAGIVRHRGKIAAMIGNARRYADLVAREGSLAAYIWRFEPSPGDLAPPQSVTVSAVSVALSKDLRRRGWAFVGPTTMQAFLQAVGVINDHYHDCVARARADAARAAFTRP